MRNFKLAMGVLGAFVGGLIKGIMMSVAIIYWLEGMEQLVKDVMKINKKGA